MRKATRHVHHLAALVACHVVAATAAAALPPNHIIMDLSPTGASASQAMGIYGDKVGGFAEFLGNSHAFYGEFAGGSSEIQPLGVTSSNIFAVGQNIQVGNVITGAAGHAAMWNRTRESYQALNDTGYSSESAAYAVHGNIAGTGVSDTTSYNQAIVWTKPGDAPVGMPTPGTLGGYAYVASTGNGIRDARVVGSATLDDSNSTNHAALWNIGNLASISFTDLHPAGFDSSHASGVWGDQAVGYGAHTASGYFHALLWTLSGDSVASVVDLHPIGYDSSYIFATNGVWQVGFGTDADGVNHALRWEGTPESAFDLGVFLPGEYESAMAFAIDDSGYIAGAAVDSFGVSHAIAWVPEPGSVGLLLLGAAMLFGRRRRVGY